MSTHAQRQTPDEPAGLGARLTAFFTSVTGVITSLVALIAAAGALYGTVLQQSGTDTTVTTTAPAPPVTMATWRRGAGAACADTYRQVRQMIPQQPTTAAEFVYFLQQVNPLYKRLGSDIAAFDRPAANAEQIATLVETMSQREALGDEAVGAWSRGDALAYQRAASQAMQLDRKGGRLMSELGLSSCVAGPWG